ncbi:hypothetical protein EW026_g5897 [Hermanssonia centrifuga]|uniref:Uncharacterized protein n=1 Tax=Hermanssonia centrifuga TaxID=98765 RepID=A0A4S4KDP1_9APHY|nr:hypothetical protein EW026_g5897 [Hermanssonia centrifuga]
MIAQSALLLRLATVRITSNVFKFLVAGAVIASIIFLGVVVLAFLWFRRRSRLRRTATTEDAKPDVPARAEDVLNRPDPNEKAQSPEPVQQQEATTLRIYGGASNATINLDPEAQGGSHGSAEGTQGHRDVRASIQSNPFTDTHSIQSASTGTHSNVIPIALVPPGSVGSVRSNPSTLPPSTQATAGSMPARPVRSPDLDLNLDHANVSNDSLRTANDRYAASAISGMSNIRNSYMTTGSYASDFLNEAPVIVTPTRGTVKQVLGIVKAEVIRTPGSSTYLSTEDMTPPQTASSVNSRMPARSPLASASFGPSDIMHGSISEEREDLEQEIAVRSDPFGDEHSPYPTATSPMSPARRSPAPSSATFGDVEESWDPQGPRLPWAKKSSRPDSYSTQAGSIISADIGTASRVHLGLDQLSPAQMATRKLGIPPSGDLPHTPISAALSTARSQYRMTSAKLITPPVSSADVTPSLPAGALEHQQRLAFEELDVRMSRASVVSSTSTRADSILEGFPFVPPSPISDRPIRTPPRSPLAQQAFKDGTNNLGGNTKYEGADSPLPQPPNRKLLGMSTGSQLSTMSNGLGSFPFQIDSGTGPEAEHPSSPPPPSFMGRQRASLDTLALTSDLSSYPLGFDRAAMDNYPGPRH